MNQSKQEKNTKHRPTDASKAERFKRMVVTSLMKDEHRIEVKELEAKFNTSIQYGLTKE